MSITSLSTTDLRKFIRFCSEDRGTGDFEIHFGLSRSEVEALKFKLDIKSPMDARKLITDVVALQEKQESIHASERQEIAKRNREAAQKRLDAATLRRQTEAADRKSKVASVTKIKNQDKKRQERFNKQQAKRKTVKKNAWRLPEDVEPSDFEREVRNRGIRFVCDRYGVLRSDIMSEVARLKLKIDFDLVPR